MKLNINDRDYLLENANVNPAFRLKARAVLRDLRGNKIPAVVVEVYRSKVRGALMRATGKSKNGSKSKHCIGRAMDVAFLVDGKLTWKVNQGWWDLFGKIAGLHGLTWGGHWTMRDYNHCELS